MLDHLLAGGAGVVPAAAHIRPDLFVRLLQLARTGCDEAARALFRQLSPLIDLMFAEPNPAPVKAALALAGLARAEVRQPLTPATRALTARAGSHHGVAAAGRVSAFTHAHSDSNR